MSDDLLGWRKHRIEALELALIQSGAEPAAAYERAANFLDEVADVWSCGHDALHCDCSSAKEQWRLAADEVRSLATPEQSAALDAVRAEARAQGMREAENRMKAAIEASGKLGRIIGFLDEDAELIAAFREACGAELIERFHAAIKGAKA